VICWLRGLTWRGAHVLFSGSGPPHSEFSACFGAAVLTDDFLFRLMFSRVCFFPFVKTIFTSIASAFHPGNDFCPAAITSLALLRSFFSLSDSAAVCPFSALALRRPFIIVVAAPSLPVVAPHRTSPLIPRFPSHWPQVMGGGILKVHLFRCSRPFVNCCYFLPSFCVPNSGPMDVSPLSFPRPPPHHLPPTTYAYRAASSLFAVFFASPGLIHGID